MKHPIYIEETIRNLDENNKFLGHIAKSLPWEKTTIAVMATDGLKFYYHEKDFAATPLHMRVAILVHEITHILNGHHARMNEYKCQPDEFNIAADLAINPIIENLGFELPSWVLRPTKELTNRSVEYIMASMFPRIPKKENPENNQEDKPQDQNCEKGEGQKSQSDQQQGEPDSDGNPSGSDNDAPSEDSGKKNESGSGSKNDSNSSENAKPEQGQNGGASQDNNENQNPADENADGGNAGQNGSDENSGNANTANSLKNKSEKMGKILPMPVESESGIPSAKEIEDDRQRIKSLIDDAGHMARMSGQDSSGFRKEIIRPQDIYKTWEEELDANLSGRGDSGLSWNRPHRGYLAQGAYMPSYVEEGIGRVSVIYDTSSSQSTKHLTESAAIIGNLLSKHGVEEVYLIMCDTRVRTAFWTSPSEIERDMKIVGRGGTRLAPGIEAAIQEGDFDTIIYQTDLKVPKGEWERVPRVEGNLYWLTQSPFLKAPVGETIRI